MALGFLRHLFLIFPVAYAPAGKHVLRGGVDHTPSQLLFFCSRSIGFISLIFYLL